MEPLYFGHSGQQLFGLLHTASDSKDLKIGVVLCNSLGQEHIRSHRCYLTIANKLAAAGVNVLRFDFFGSGDSAGNLEEAHIANWIDDIHTAVTEVKQRCEVDQIYLVGVRFGATLASMYAAKHFVDGVVLWSPVINGKQYTEELQLFNRNWLNGTFATCKKPEKGAIESLGFIFPKPLVEEIKAINLVNTNYNPKIQFSIVEGEDNPPIENLIEVLKKGNINPIFKQVESNEFWVKRKDVEANSLVPLATINIIVDLISKEHS